MDDPFSLIAKDQPQSAAASSSFDLLNPGVQRWIWRQGWRDLRDIQEAAIPILLGGSSDAIIAAATASGKTEAAFFPIVSSLADRERAPNGFGALYIGPLRALINDQFGRVELLCTEMEIPVFRWHGDVPASAKARARRVRDGIVLMTPESLEALLIRRGGEARQLFGALSHVVIDEMHSFMGTARGKQLQSLLYRLELALGRPVARVGLSATLADMADAAVFLRPTNASAVAILESASAAQELLIQVRGYVDAGAGKARPPRDDQPDPGFPLEGESILETEVKAPVPPTETLSGDHLSTPAVPKPSISNRPLSSTGSSLSSSPLDLLLPVIGDVSRDIGCDEAELFDAAGINQTDMNKTSGAVSTGPQASSTMDTGMLDPGITEPDMADPGTPDPEKQAVAEEEEPVDEADATASAISGHLFATLKNKRALIFAGSRARVETYAAKLADRCENEGIENRFLAHHGSLSREFREDAERRMKDESRPASVVCTSTLEIGIDVGAIDQVAQIGAGHSVSGLRQRIGRSGRRAGRPAMLRVYIAEKAINSKIHPLDAMRPETIKCIAMINLMMRKWNEPTIPGLFHLSTLIHQILALILQHGGISAQRAYDTLIRSGVFDAVEPALFRSVLRRMGEPKVGLIEQAPDGTLMLGKNGEHLTSGHDFFAVFATPDEYRIIHRARTLGQLAIDAPLCDGDLIIFGGKRWRIVHMDEKRRIIAVERARSGKAPVFAGDGAALSDGLVAEMRHVWEGDEEPAFLDPQAIVLLREGRATYRDLGLAGTSLVEIGGKTLAFPWTGSRGMMALSLSFRQRKIASDIHGIAIEVETSSNDVRAILKDIDDQPVPDPSDLIAMIENKAVDKYDVWLSQDLLCLNAGRAMLDCGGLKDLCRRMLASNGGFEIMEYEDGA